MNIYIVIPAHNEAEYISSMLQSIAQQTYLPKKVVVVNDHSTDETAEIVKRFSEIYSFISLLSISSSESHLPGSKVVQAFYKGFELLDQHYDIICKFDADLIFPKNYLENLVGAFKENSNLGIYGGHCFIERDHTWKLESLTDKDHIRGALKAYRKECFEAIGGLKKSMGWDTADELLANYHGWKVSTNPDLHVKHLRPTGETYNIASKHKQGEAFYKLRYGFSITFIASLKLALKKKRLSLCADYLIGYFKAKRAKSPFLVNEKEGKWIRNYRWKKMREKLF